jgi:hypothetical protein
VELSFHNTSGWNDGYSLLFSLSIITFSSKIHNYTKLHQITLVLLRHEQQYWKQHLLLLKTETLTEIYLRNYKSSPYNLNTFHYYYLWLITGSNLQETLLSIVQSSDRAQIFTYLHQNCQYTKEELIIWVSRSSTIFFYK